MKKIVILLALAGVTSLSYSQTQWDMNLNHINPGYNPNLGTSSNDPLRFYTNNTQRMVLSSSGALSINSLTGSTSRFLQVSADGVLGAWTGTDGNQNKILYGDATWQIPPFKISGSNIVPYSTTAKLGIGTITPATELDVVGNVQVSKYLGVGKGISMGNNTDFAAIYYVPATSTLPGVVHFGGRPGGASYPDQNGGGGDGSSSISPTADFCSGASLVPYNNLGEFDNNIFINNSNSAGQVYGKVRIGHTGAKGFIEVQGFNSEHPSDLAPLVLNPCGRRNVYAFGGETFESASTNVMSVTGKLNVTDRVQVGAASSTSFVENSQLYLLASGSIGTGAVKVRQENSDYGMELVLAGHAEDEALGIYYTTDATDGNQTFLVRANGETNINTISPNAINVTNGSTGSQSFLLKSDGQTKINTSNAEAFIISDAQTHAVNFKVKKNGYAYAREVVVTLNNFPDYVFANDYKLPKLKDVKSFIEKNHRLPNMPSAKSVETDGAHLGEIQKVTVEKVEELYLYILQLEEKINDLTARLEKNQSK